MAEPAETDAAAPRDAARARLGSALANVSRLQLRPRAGADPISESRRLVLIGGAASGTTAFAAAIRARAAGLTNRRSEMAKLAETDAKHVFTTWHDTVRNRDLAGTAALYAEGAVLETPLALAVYPERQSGLVVGRPAILTFFEDSIRKFPSDLAQWFRTGVYFVNGKQLTWEYPRVAPEGDQVDLMEMMEIEHGFIASHRVYWGWYGVRLLSRALASVPR